ncbi:MAG: 4-hydroxythreonine-4-phosphate dehydrogenase PdxA [Alphaproteobacteria bacterium]|nr:4-hydroxythreonine-4-phosphate dehydrogenase PdxA [Alphaproteobacteria bacterium]
MAGHADGLLAVTMGEPAGIGGELTMLAWQSRMPDQPPFFVVDDPARLARICRNLGWSIPIEAVTDAGHAREVFDNALPVVPITVPVAVEPGRPNSKNAAAVLASIDRCLTLVREGAADALVTNPIHKHVLMDAGFEHPGHTDYLAQRAGSAGRAVMMLVSPSLRVVPVTVHLPLAQVSAALSEDLIVRHCQATEEALRRDFAVANPRIAVAALNPHGGEGGVLGKEEIEIIQPAVEHARTMQINVIGPTPADSLFHPIAREQFDAAICMYHDQALIPLKTLDFDAGVNVTIGLPFIRTSPDHGTAFDIAGTGRANPRSMIEALKLAAVIAQRRAQSAKTA